MSVPLVAAPMLYVPVASWPKYALCGPDVYTLRQLVALAGTLSGNERPIVALGPALGRLQARVLECLPGAPMTRDNLASMERDSVCDAPFPAVFGIEPTALAAVAPTSLGAAAKRSRYDHYRSHGSR